jgi:hypothetical protein
MEQLDRLTSDQTERRMAHLAVSWHGQAPYSNIVNNLLAQSKVPVIFVGEAWLQSFRAPRIGS